MLAQLDSVTKDEHSSERETGDQADPANAIVAEGVDNAVLAELQRRLAAIERAEQRLAAGTFGLSVRSGLPIPDERLEAMPTAELTVEEAARPT